MPRQGARTAGVRARARLLTEAGDVAKHLPAHTPAGTTFTRSQMPLYRIAIYNALGQFGRSLTIARTIPPASIATVERRTRLYTDVARAWYGFGDRARCLDALEQVERLAAEDVRRPSVHELTSRMLSRPGSAPPRLMAFAKRNGLAA